MTADEVLAGTGVLFLVAVFVISFLLLRRAQRKPDTKPLIEGRRALNPDEERRLRQRLEREARREERERQEQAAKDAAETARASSYLEKLRKREHEREEREQREAEAIKKREKELNKWKTAISKIDEGTEETQRDLSSVEEFLEYIQRRKIVEVESVAAAFRLDVSTVVARINDLINQGRIFGVFDDRGRFIHILDSEVRDIQKHVLGITSRKTLKEICQRIGGLVSSNSV